MIETQTTQTDTTISDLKAAVREASAYERELAVETDELPARIQEAAREDARRQARAAREVGTGVAVQAAADSSAVPAMRERQASLKFLRWSAGIRTASLEVELANAQIAESERRANELEVGLEGLKLDAAEANRLLDERLAAIRRASSTDGFTHARHKAKQRLRDLEGRYPDA